MLVYKCSHIANASILLIECLFFYSIPKTIHPEIIISVHEWCKHLPTKFSNEKNLWDLRNLWSNYFTTTSEICFKVAFTLFRKADG